jgi:ABC-type thiamin/hydroxymethylpyrimidine transport system permease subunit
MPALLWTVVSWLLRTVVIQFVVMGVVLVIVTKLMPLAMNYVTSFVTPGGLTSVFNGLPSGVWFFLDFFALDIGLPLVLSAYISRFLIRRIPFIG